jgi:hypothetical protein
MQCSVSSLAYTGDVTALCVAHLPPLPGGSAATPLLLAGMGSQLHVYALPAGQRCCCAAVLPDATRLHGIAWLPAAAGGSAAAERPHLLLAVHGGRHAALLSLLGPTPVAAAGSHAGGGWEVRVLARLPRLQHWTMDVQLSWAGGVGVGGVGSREQGACSGGVHIALGLSNNAVEAFHVSLPPSDDRSAPDAAAARCLLRAAGRERCLLYSMALLPRRQPSAHSVHSVAHAGHAAAAGEDSERTGSGGGDGGGDTFWLVAGGSVYLDVLVWATPAMPAAGAAAAAAAGAAAPTLLRLQGHEGSIHRWGPLAQAGAPQWQLAGRCCRWAGGPPLGVGSYARLAARPSMPLLLPFPHCPSFLAAGCAGRPAAACWLPAATTARCGCGPSRRRRPPPLPLASMQAPLPPLAAPPPPVRSCALGGTCCGATPRDCGTAALAAAAPAAPPASW